MQSPANPSLGKIPVNREIYREFRAGEWACSRLSRVKTEVNGFRPEIVTGNEQGNNRRDNRENVVRNRRITARRYLATQLIKDVKIFYTRLSSSLFFVPNGIQAHDLKQLLNIKLQHNEIRQSIMRVGHPRHECSLDDASERSRSPRHADICPLATEFFRANSKMNKDPASAIANSVVIAKP
jgi:hypothetical protein